MRRHKRGAIALAAALMLTAAPAALASDLLDIGYVDQGAIANLRPFVDASRQLADYKQTLDQQFADRMRAARSSADQEHIADEFQAKLADRQHALFAALLSKASVAVASVASSRNLSIVVDKRIVIYGGQDITGQVIDLLNGPAGPVPPVSTPPPSEVGYVDQTQIDAIPQIILAGDAFDHYQSDQERAAQGAMAKAKSDADRNQILQGYQKALADRENQLIQPLIDRTKDVMASVARSKNLILVIDKGNVIYGGTDVTSDVVSSFK